VRVLLDTCTVIWATMTPTALSQTAREIIGEPQNEVMVSAATAWEIATKVRLGKLPEAAKLESSFIDVMRLAGYTLLSVDTESALRAGRMVAPHRDPFDRMIAAQALGLDIPVLSPDAPMDQLGVRRVW
jgi:PIN domain nuclease of toxin-antitoxin system